MIDGLLILAALHVDEIADDQAADIAQAQLAADFVGGFHVGLEDGFLDVLGALVAAGVDVDGDERLGLVDDDVAAARQPDLAVEGVVDLLLDAEALEDGRRFGVVLDAALGAAGDAADEILHPLDGVGIVADDGVDFIGEEVAHGALDEVGLAEDADGRGLFLRPAASMARHCSTSRPRSRTK